MGGAVFYILRCADGSYYAGSALDLGDRLKTHSSGKGPRYTAARLPVMLVYTEQHASLAEAVRRERQVKTWTRAKKEALIKQDFGELKRLSKRRN